MSYDYEYVSYSDRGACRGVVYFCLQLTKRLCVIVLGQVTYT